MMNGQVCLLCRRAGILTAGTFFIDEHIDLVAFHVQKLSGRTVAVDWAIAKAEFQRTEAGLLVYSASSQFFQHKIA